MVFELLEAAQKSWRRLVPNPVVTGLSPVTPDDTSKTWSRACIGRRRPGNAVGNSEHHPYGPHRKLSSRNAHPRRDAYLRVEPMATTEKPTAVC
jgi:hypothetical protein